MGKPAIYSIASYSPDKCVLEDEGAPWDEHLTITNDAENVVGRLVSKGLLKPNQKLFYIDSNGDQDEILIEDGKFAGFKLHSNALPAVL